MMDSAGLETSENLLFTVGLGVKKKETLLLSLLAES